MRDAVGSRFPQVEDGHSVRRMSDFQCVVLPYASGVKPVGLVALGGIIGSLSRALVATWVPTNDSASFPIDTLAVNLLGCVLMGMLVFSTLHRWPDRMWLRPLLGAGVLGGFTTFSAFAGEAVLIADAGKWWMSAVYVAVTVIGGVLCIRLGEVLGRAVFSARGSA